MLSVWLCVNLVCKAGIPIVTKQGVNGGISIMENYKLDKYCRIMEVGLYEIHMD